MLSDQLLKKKLSCLLVKKGFKIMAFFQAPRLKISGYAPDFK